MILCHRGGDYLFSEDGFYNIDGGERVLGALMMR